MKHIQKKSGFTLIELLVVIVILGILSTISVGTFRSYFAKARDSERVSTVQNVAMMIKVDSGGAGDCGVYNYLDASKKTSAGTEDCSHMGDLETLLSENDYSMPGGKNGLEYFYAFKIGATEGDNEFFIVIGTEEETAQNGKVIEGSTNSVFIDGTVDGIKELVESGGACDWDNATHLPGCGAAWTVHPINDDGTLGAALTPTS